MLEKKNSNEWHYHLAVFSLFTSFCALFILTTCLPSIYYKSLNEQGKLLNRALNFKDQTDRIWQEVRQLHLAAQGGPKPLLFSRAKRQYFDNLCRGCGQLACPTGPPGPPGGPGTDGKPGDAGNQGRAGDDGMDVQLDADPEMPCVVCPSGPVGPRGSQGERGRTGNAGPSGEQGPHGHAGMPGEEGLRGSAGAQGPKGPEGLQGHAGKTAVAGVGIKGPKGPLGPAGMKGPPGPPGRGSVHPGETGPPGEPGEAGEPGKEGIRGNEGPYGPPGDSGMPAAYCPSDCGVQQILTNIPVGPIKEMMRHYNRKPSGGSTGYSRSRMMDAPTFGSRRNRIERLKLHDIDGDEWAYVSAGVRRDAPLFKPRKMRLRPAYPKSLMRDPAFRRKLARKLARRMRH